MRGTGTRAEEERAGYPELPGRIRGGLHEGFGIDHQMIQIEPGGLVEKRGTI